MRAIGVLTWVFPNGSTLETAAYEQFNILAHAEVFELTIAQACGGQAECGTCRVRVLAGEVTAMQGEEVQLRAEHRAHFGELERLACRVRPLGDVRVAVRTKRPPDFRGDDA